MKLYFKQKSVGETTYLILDADSNMVMDSFAINMMAYNHINGVVPVQVVQKDENRQIQFDITGLKKLSEKMDVPRTKKEVLEILGSMLNAYEEAEAYMLDPGHLFLAWQYVYLDEKDNCMFLYLPVSWDCGVSRIAFLHEVVSRIKPDEQERDPYLYDILNAFGRGAVKKLSDFREQLKKSAGIMPEQPAEEYKTEYREEQKKEPDAASRQADFGDMIPAIREKEQREKENKEDRESKDEKKPVVSASLPILNIPGREAGKKAAPEKSEEKKKGEKEEKKKAREKTKEGKDNKKGFFKRKKENQGNEIGFEKKKNHKIVIPEANNKQLYSSDDHRHVMPDNRRTGEDGMYESYEATVIMQEPAKDEGEGTILLQEPSERTSARLVQKRGGFTYGIQKAQTIIGSGAAADIHIENKAVSRCHATITCVGGQYYITDNQSKNGSFIDGRRLQPGVREAVSNGAAVRLANEEFEFWDN